MPATVLLQLKLDTALAYYIPRNLCQGTLDPNRCILQHLQWKEGKQEECRPQQGTQLPALQATTVHKPHA